MKVDVWFVGIVGFLSVGKSFGFIVSPNVYKVFDKPADKQQGVMKWMIDLIIKNI